MPIRNSDHLSCLKTTKTSCQSKKASVTSSHKNQYSPLKHLGCCCWSEKVLPYLGCLISLLKPPRSGEIGCSVVRIAKSATTGVENEWKTTFNKVENRLLISGLLQQLLISANFSRSWWFKPEICCCWSGLRVKRIFSFYAGLQILTELGPTRFGANRLVMTDLVDITNYGLAGTYSNSRYSKPCGQHLSCKMFGTLRLL